MGLFDYSAPTLVCGLPLYMAGVVCYCLVKTTNSETQETENTSVCNIQTLSMVLLDSFLSDWRGEPYQFHSFT